MLKWITTGRDKKKDISVDISDDPLDALISGGAAILNMELAVCVNIMLVSC